MKSKPVVIVALALTLLVVMLDVIVEHPVIWNAESRSTDKVYIPMSDIKILTPMEDTYVLTMVDNSSILSQGYVSTGSACVIGHWDYNKESLVVDSDNYYKYMLIRELSRFAMYYALFYIILRVLREGDKK